MIKRTITIVAVLGLILALPGVAMAQTATTTQQATRRIEAVKDRAQQSIDNRLDTIKRLRFHLDNGHATADHAATLTADLDQAEAGLNDLAGQIRSATTLEELRVLVPQIATEFRIYVVIAPKTLEVATADTILWAVDNPLTRVHDKLADIIDRAFNAGYDVSEAQAALQDMQAHMTQVEAHASPVPGQVIGLQASDWENPAKALLDQGHDKLLQAREELLAARVSANAAGDALRAALNG